MTLSFAISLTTAICTGVFAVFVLMRYLAKRRMHLLAWGFGLAFYCFGAVAQATLDIAFNEFAFKLWYWAGALAVAAWLGQGTAFLLVRRGKFALISFYVVLALSILGAILVFFSSIDPTAYQPQVELTAQYKHIFTATGISIILRTILVIVLNTYGTLWLVGGAIWSAFLFWRKRVLPQRTTGNLLIAAGGLLPAFSGTLVLFGRPEYKYLGELFGGMLLFSGFLLATAEKDARKLASA